MTGTRTRRFIGGLSLGYLQTAVVTIAGLWLTPYFLRHLDQHDYGLWLVAAQMLFYLALTDLGVVAMLPREIAFATGSANSPSPRSVPQLVGEITALVYRQLPVVGLAAAVMWWLVWKQWPALGGPFGIVAATFVVAFPLRRFPAMLQGLQDLTVFGAVQMVAWAAGTIVTVIFVQRGTGIYGLAAGWACTQSVSAGLAWWRLQRRFPDALPRAMPSLSLSLARAYLGRGVWISVSQVAQVLLNGTDLIVIGAVLGPAAVVPYACTAKLITLLSNQPQLFMQTALPALSELRASVPRARMFEVSAGLSQLLLICSGAIACVVLVVNGPFVSWWVGPDRYAGARVTVLMSLAMLLRHWNVSAVYTLFCFGHERRLAITTAVDGLVSLVAMSILVRWIGISGAVLGSMIGTCAISLPANLTALAREQGTSLGSALRPLRPWFTRFVLMAATILIALEWRPDLPMVTGALAAGGVAMVYLAVMTPVALRPPLGSMLAPRLRPWLAFVPGWPRRLAKEPAS